MLWQQTGNSILQAFVRFTGFYMWPSLAAALDGGCGSLEPKPERRSFNRPVDGTKQATTATTVDYRKLRRGGAGAGHPVPDQAERVRQPGPRVGSDRGRLVRGERGLRPAGRAHRPRAGRQGDQHAAGRPRPGSGATAPEIDGGPTSESPCTSHGRDTWTTGSSSSEVGPSQTPSPVEKRGSTGGTASAEERDSY